MIIIIIIVITIIVRLKDTLLYCSQAAHLAVKSLASTLKWQESDTVQPCRTQGQLSC